MSKQTPAGDDAELEAMAALEFAPAVPSGGEQQAPRPRRGARPAPGAWRRRLATILALFIALSGVGVVYTLFASASGAADTQSASTDVAAGRSIYESSCITCHGANLQGVIGRGISLVGVGQAAVYYQVSTGRMPLVQQGAQADRKPASYSDAQIEQIAAYVNTYGGGPAIPAGSLRVSTSQLGEGGQLFRLNCAQCHGFSGKGAPLSAGKYAPSLAPATDAQIYGAMASGPESMPVFNDNQLTPDQKKSIITYIQTLKVQKDSGGAGIGRIGPVSEGLVIWIVGLGLLMVTILWIGAKS